MNTLAAVFDDRPRPEPLLLLWALLPSAVILASWVLIRCKKWLAGVALLIAAGAACTILVQMREATGRLEAMRKTRPDIAIEPFFPEYVMASWFAALAPVVLIVCFYVTERGRTSR